MGQLLVTTDTERWWYEPISSIRDYSEPDFEEKFFKYSEKLFANFFAVKFKFDFITKEPSGKKYKPDQLLISKDFKKWVIVEVELCKDDLSHTINQIICFDNPIYKPDEVIAYIIKQEPKLVTYKKEVTDLITNTLPELLVIMDDYCDNVFTRLRRHKPGLKICVLEVYKTAVHPFESYRIGGDYPYDISSTSKLEYIDPQTYEVARPKIIENIAIGDIHIFFNMKPIPATILKGRGKKRYIKIPDHNFTKTTMLQLGIDTSSKLIIQRL